MTAAPIDADGPQARPAEVGLLLFGLSTHLYALPIAEAVEVIAMPPCTPVPRTPPYLLGVCFRRGRLLPIVDLGKRLGLRQGFRSTMLPSSRSDRPSVLVARGRLGEIGLLVDRILRVMRVPAAAIRRSGAAPCTLGTVAAASSQALLLDLEAVGLQGLQEPSFEARSP